MLAPTPAVATPGPCLNLVQLRQGSNGRRRQIAPPARTEGQAITAVPFLDSSGAKMIEGLAHKAQRQGVTLWLTGASREMRRTLLTHGLRPPLVRYARSIDSALSRRGDQGPGSASGGDI